MDQFVWKPSFEIGIEKIDHEHKRLLTHLNNGIANPNITNDIFDEMKQYAKFHFSDEEILMDRVGYPRLVTHQQGHRMFESRVEQLEGAVNNGESKAIILLISFLRDWFLEHILAEDMGFANYLRQNMNEEEMKNLFVHN